jgi:iron complex outermembrane receptor protein
VLDGPPSNLINAEAAEGQSPRHQVTLRSQWEVTRSLSLDATLYYVDALPAFDIDDSWRLDLRLGWQIYPGWEVDVVGQNLLKDARREFSSPTALDATEIQRAGYLRVKWRF